MKTWKDYPELRNRDALEHLLETEKTPMRIARHLNCSRESVKHAMKHHDLRMKKFHVKEEMRRRLSL